MKKIFFFLLLLPILAQAQFTNSGSGTWQNTPDLKSWRIAFGSRGIVYIYQKYQVDSGFVKNGYAPQNASFNITKSGTLDSTLTINSGFAGYNTVLFSRHDNSQAFEIQQNGETIIKAGVAGAAFVQMGNVATKANNFFGGINLTGSLGAVNGVGNGTLLNNIVYAGANGDTVVGVRIQPSLSNGTPITALKTLVGGSGYTNGTYNVTFNSGSTHYGATGTLTVAGGTVTVCTLTYGGYNYAPNDVLTAVFGGGSGFSVTVNTVGAYTGTVHIGTKVYGGLQLVPGTVSSVAAVLSEGTFYAITDSSTNTPGGTITGGGSFHVAAYYNGTNLIVL